MGRSEVVNVTYAGETTETWLGFPLVDWVLPERLRFPPGIGVATASEEARSSGRGT